MTPLREKRCGGCGATGILAIFSLGSMPLVNAFLTPEELIREESFGLDVFCCPRCTLVQLGEVVEPHKLFSNYLYTSATSPSNVKHLRSVAEFVGTRLSVRSSSRVLEIGSNDGTLLGLLKNRTSAVLGVDPARNLAEASARNGVETLIEFFSEALATRILEKYGSFDVVVALNVVAHTPQFVSMLRGVRELLAKNGRFILECAYVAETLLHGQFDTVYHEHVYYFSMHALCEALRNSGLVATDVEVIPTQGRSIRVTAGKAEDRPEVSPSVPGLLTQERAIGVTEPAMLLQAAERFVDFKEKLRDWVRVQKSAARTIAGLGAPARGMVILNYCGMREGDLKYVVDDSPLKQGRLTPGSHFPIVSWEALENDPADTYLLLSWNYREDLLEKLKARVRHGRVLIPFPEFREMDIHG